MYFNERTSYNNMTYSIDMIRLKTYIDYDVFSNLEFHIKTYYSDKIEQFWISDRIMCFKYNYKILIEEGVGFYFAFKHNNETAETHDGLYNLTIEFNPNKLKDNKLIYYILKLSGNWFIRSFDLAVDLKINILDLIVDKGKKRDVKIFSNGFDNKTYEIGKGDMRLKIYNKKHESKLDVPYDLTRIEISRTLDDFPISDIKFYNYEVDGFPEIYTNDFICSLSEYKDKTMFAIIYAVQSGFPINDLSRVYKEKIKKLFEGGHKLRFTSKDATSVLRKTIFTYFMWNDKVRFK